MVRMGVGLVRRLREDIMGVLKSNSDGMVIMVRDSVRLEIYVDDAAAVKTPYNGCPDVD